MVQGPHTRPRPRRRRRVREEIGKKPVVAKKEIEASSPTASLGPRRRPASCSTTATRRSRTSTCGGESARPPDGALPARRPHGHRPLVPGVTARAAATGKPERSAIEDDRRPLRGRRLRTRAGGALYISWVTTRPAGELGGARRRQPRAAVPGQPTFATSPARRRASRAMLAPERDADAGGRRAPLGRDHAAGAAQQPGRGVRVPGPTPRNADAPEVAEGRGAEPGVGGASVITRS